MASLIQRTWVWANSRRWWRTRKPGMLQSMGSQKSDTTEQLNNNKFPGGLGLCAHGPQIVNIFCLLERGRFYTPAKQLRRWFGGRPVPLPHPPRLHGILLVYTLTWELLWEESGMGTRAWPRRDTRNQSPLVLHSGNIFSYNNTVTQMKISNEQSELGRGIQGQDIMECFREIHNFPLFCFEPGTHRLVWAWEL